VLFGGAVASLSLLTPRHWHLYAIFFVLGVVGNGTAQMAYSRAVSSWFEKRRGTALAVVMSGGAVGAMVLPPTAEALIQTVGWRQACIVLGAVVLVVGVPIVARFIRERPVNRGAASALGGATVREGVTSRVFWILVTVLFAQSIAQNGALTHMAALLTDRGVPPSGAALALSAMGAASLVGRLATGWILDRFFAPRVGFCLLSIAALGTYVLAGAHSLTFGVIAAAMIGFGMGAEADVTPYILSRYLGLRSFATLYGFTWTAYAIAGAVGPILMGRAFDATGSYTTLLTQLALGTFFIAALLLLMPGYERAFKPPAPEASLG
jgi:MFS family permease